MEQSQALHGAHLKFLIKRIRGYKKRIEFFFYTTKLSYIAVVTGTESYFSKVNRKNLEGKQALQGMWPQIHWYLDSQSTSNCLGLTFMTWKPRGQMKIKEKTRGSYDSNLLA